MKTEAYEAYIEYRATREKAIQKTQRALIEAQTRREPLQKKRAQELLSMTAPLHGGKIVEGVEPISGKKTTDNTATSKALVELDAEIDRHEVVLAFLRQGQDADDEEKFVRAAVDEQNGNITELSAELNAAVAAIEPVNDTLWKKIETYIDARKVLIEELTRRDGILVSVEGKPYAEDLKKSTQTGRIESMNVNRLPLVQVSDVFKRFGRDAR